MATLSTTPFKDYKNPLVALQAWALYSAADTFEASGNVNAAAEARKAADALVASLVPKSSTSRAPVKQMIQGITNVAGNFQQYLSDDAKAALDQIVASLHAAASTIDANAQAALGDVLDAVAETVRGGLITATGGAQALFQQIADALGVLKARLEETDTLVPVRDVVSAIANALSSLTTTGNLTASQLTDRIQDVLSSIKQRREERQSGRGERQSLLSRLRRDESGAGEREGIVKNLFENLRGRLGASGGSAPETGTETDGEQPRAPAALLQALRNRTRRPRGGIAQGDATANDVQASTPVVAEILRYLQPLLNGTPLESTEFVLFVAPHDAAVKVATMAVNSGLIKPERYTALVERLDRLYEEAKYSPTELSDTMIYGGSRIAIPIGMNLTAIVVQVLSGIIEVVVNIVYQVVVKIPGINFIPLPASLPPLLTNFITPFTSALLTNETLQAYTAVAIYVLLDVPFEVADRLAVRVFERLTPEDVNTVRSRVFHTLITNLEAI